MIYLSLFWEFLKIGLFAFGGAYGAIPLIQESVLSKGWMNEAMFANIIAISESTPGPIMVNVATYVGNIQAGILGAGIATLGVILPSFIITILIMVILHSALKHPVMQAIFSGVKPCIIGIILATGGYMLFTVIFGSVQKVELQWQASIILLLLGAMIVIYSRIKKKEPSPIVLIVISAILGILIY